MEKTTADLMRLVSTRAFDSIEDANAFLQQALDRMYAAWNATGRRRVQLARDALALSPNCADAYVLLAEEAARTVEEARDFYAKGVEA